jgi:ubiquinone/menaquinone biosynthesis C-methylase UbiE
MSVKSIYNKWATLYDWDQDTIFLFDLEKKGVMDMLNLDEHDMVLDIWCGVWRYISLILKKTKNITCSDFSPNMMNIISLKYSNITCIPSDLTKTLPFKNTSFNKILCTQVLKHIKDITSTFKEIYRILTKNREFVLTIIHPEASWNWYELRYKNKFEVEWDCYITRHTLSQILDAIQDSKMQIVWMKQMLVGKEVKHLLTDKSYKILQWKPLILSIKVRKT